MKLGTLAEAEVLAKASVRWANSEIRWRSPNGFRKIGSGSSRFAILGPSGVVYKVPKDGCGSVNLEEMNNIERLSKEHMPGWRIPKASLWTVEDVSILAMEHVQGTMERWYDVEYNIIIDRGYMYEILDFLEMYGIEDVHDENFIVESDGTRVLIDLAA